MVSINQTGVSQTVYQARPSTAYRGHGLNGIISENGIISSCQFHMVVNIGSNYVFGKRLHLVTHNEPLIKRLLMRKGQFVKKRWHSA